MLLYLIISNSFQKTFKNYERDFKINGEIILQNSFKSRIKKDNFLMYFKLDSI